MKIQKFEVNLFGENTYIIWDEATGEAAVVDPGMTSSEEFQAIESFLVKNHLNLKAILLTHQHVDHIFGVEQLRKLYGVPVISHSSDSVLGERAVEQARMFHLPMEMPPMIPDRLVNDGDILNLGKEEIYALHAPGHSPGSLLYYIPSAGMLLTGDVLFRGSIGRTDLPGGNYNQLLSSIHKKILTLPPSTIVYPGHGPTTTIADEMRSNPFF